ncbi:MAG: hypothetical protein AAGK78_03715 [Planctomycetota bacterium]
MFGHDAFEGLNESLKASYLSTERQLDPLGDPAVATLMTPLQRASQSKLKRNEFVYALMSIVDHEYSTYEVELSTTTRLTNLLLELTTLSLTSASTITRGEEAKTVLSGLATLVTGTRIAVDKELFYQNQLPILVARMRALRLAKRAEITKRLMDSSLEDYPVTAALGDVFEYYNAGTISVATADIARESADLLEEASKKMDYAGDA